MIESIAIGDELLTGKISDTNSTFVATELFKVGYRLDRQTVLADDELQMTEVLLSVAERAKVAICFGGLGPTSDDKTVDVVCELVKCAPIVHEASRDKLEARYRERQREVTPQALRQVRYPSRMAPLYNSVGMAPGFHGEINNCHFFFFPGVPAEMKSLFQIQALPLIQEKLKGVSEKIFFKTWKCLGLWESDLQKLMDPIESNLPKGFWLGYRTVYPENHLTLYFRGADKGAAWASVDQRLTVALKPFAYNETESQGLEESLLDQLAIKNIRVCLVESATGGLAVQRLTRVPGASQVIWGGMVPYQSEAKRKWLGVERPTEESCISEVTTRELAFNALNQSKVDLTAAITGKISPLENSALSSGVFYLGVLYNKNGKELYVSKTIELGHKTRPELQWAATSYLIFLMREVVGL